MTALEAAAQIVFSVVIPIFNEEEIVEALHAAVSHVLGALGQPWEVIYVNDGSTDSSLPKLLAIQARDAHVVVLELSRNWGHQPALSAGLRAARGSAVMMMDGDLQDPPQVLAEMVHAWRNGAQIVVAQRRKRHETGFRAWAIPLFYQVLRLLSDFPIPLNAGIFGLLDRQIVDEMNALEERNRYLPGLRSWVGYATAVVYYDRPDRAVGRPKQNFRRLLKYALDAIFSFSYKPMRLALGLGAAIACAGLAALALLAGGALVGGQVRAISSDSAALLSLVILLGGLQLICIGVLGEYVGRIYEEVKRRPLFLVQKTHRGAASPAWVAAAPAPAHEFTPTPLLQPSSLLDKYN